MGPADSVRVVTGVEMVPGDILRLHPLLRCREPHITFTLRTDRLEDRCSR